MSWNIFGHEWAVEMLQRDLAHDRVRHAYLFTGPAGIGKRTIVSEFTRALLCTGSGERPCGQCRACMLLARGSHPDVLTVAPAESGARVRTARIKIDPVRQLIYDLTLKPVEAGRRVAQLLRFDTATTEAMNVFLKTLEEPPGQAVILLTAESADNTLPTIVSRCQVLPLRPLPLATVREALITRWQAEAPQADLLAHLAQGRLAWAVGAHAQPATLEARTQKLDDLEALVAGSRVARFAYADRLTRKASVGELQDTLALWQGYWRDVLLATAGTQAPLANPDRAAAIRALAGEVAPQQAGDVIASLRRTSDLLDRNVNARLALEVCLLGWPRVAVGQSHAV
jgi:DNA polymerase-3 subunit delta'